MLQSLRWRCFVLLLCGLLFLVAFPSRALDPKKSIDQYVRDHWTTEDGLPQNSVNAILQTRDGYLWVATFGGLAHFDGLRFTVYDTAQSPGLSSNRLTALLEDHDGTLWIGSEDGKVIRRTGGTYAGVFETLVLPAGVAVGPIWDLHQDETGRIWIAALRNLLFWDPATEELQAVDPELLPHGAIGLDQGASGRLLVGGEDGWARREVDGSWTDFDLMQHRPSPYWIHTLEEDEDVLRLGTTAGLMQGDRADGEVVSWENLSMVEIDDSHPTGEMLRDRHESLWFTRGRSVVRWFAGKGNVRSTDVFLSDARLRALYEDREGSLWIGSDGGGLYRLYDGPFTSWSASQGFTDVGVLPIIEVGSEMWFGTLCEGFFRRRDGRFEPVLLPDWLNCASALLSDRDGRIWLGGNGLAIFREERLKPLFITDDPESPENVSALYQDRGGRVWVGLRGRGIRAYLPRNAPIEQWETRRWTSAEGLIDDDVRFFMEDRSGFLWIGTHNGLSRFDPEREQFRSFTVEDGLPHGFVRAIHEDADGILWIGTYGGGLARFTAGEVTTVYSRSNGLPENIVSRILPDGDDFWLAGNRGITRVSRGVLEEYALGRRDRITANLYGRADGMLTSETNGGCQPAGWRASDGKLWFPTVRGVTVVDPRRLRVEEPPPVHLERILVDQQVVRLPDENATLVIEPGDRRVHHLEVDYTGIQLALPKEVSFRHRLVGFVDEWIPAANRREAYYSAVPPGTYRFEVSAAAYSGGEWGEPVGFEIEVRPHWWQIRSLQAVFALLFLAGSGFLIFRTQTRRLRFAREHAQALTEANLRMEDEISRRREVERERELVIEELETRSEELERFTYTVSHDLKSPVVTIRGFMGMIRKDLENGRPERIEGDLRRIEKATDRMTLLLDELLELSRVGRRINPPENVDLGELAREALELVAGNVTKSGAVVEIAEDLPRRPVDRPRMREVFQNLIDNGVRFMGDRTEPRIEVGWRREGKRVIFFVRDNGMGIDPIYHQKVFGLFERLDSGVDGTGIGLALVRRIIEVHEGKIWVESEGLGHGACFCFTLGEIE